MQDSNLRRALVEACKRYGLAVVGYSGRDQSVMSALEEGIDSGQGYPSGLFWFRRAGSPLLSHVTDLIAKASDEGIDAHVIDVETFDELMADILLVLPDLPTETTSLLNRERRRVSDAPLPGPEGTWPVLRLNALPVLSWPTVARRVVCNIGGIKEVREAISQSGTNIIGTRRQVGVIAFGRDAEVREAFAQHQIAEFDRHSIEARRLRYESAELGLLYDALCHALVRELPLTAHRRRTGYIIIPNVSQSTADTFLELRRATRDIAGQIPGTRLQWSEAIRIRLEYRLDRLWLIMEPTIWFERANDDAEFDVAKEFVRERLARRYNAASNQVIAAWASIITAGEQEREIHTFGIGDGIDAAFTIARTTGYSYLERSR